MTYTCICLLPPVVYLCHGVEAFCKGDSDCPGSSYCMNYKAPVASKYFCKSAETSASDRLPRKNLRMQYKQHAEAKAVGSPPREVYC